MANPILRQASQQLRAQEAAGLRSRIHDLEGQCRQLKRVNHDLLREMLAAHARAKFLDEVDVELERGRIENALQKERQGSSVAVVVLTDWHLGEKFSSKVVSGLNSYSVRIAEQRAHKLIEKVLEMLSFVRHWTTIDTMVLALLGDFISGSIHEELLATEEISAVEQSILMQQLLVDVIDALLKHGKLKRIIIPCCYGNHGRVTKKMTVSNAAKQSYEWLTYKRLESLYGKEKRVQFLVTENLHNYLKVEGHRLRFSHGHAIKYHGGVGSISIPVNKAIAAWNKSIVADVDYFGHWHQFMETDSWVSCPSLVGYGPFSLFVKAEFSLPAQLFSVVSRKHGKVLAEKIYVN